MGLFDDSAAVAEFLQSSWGAQLSSYIDLDAVGLDEIESKLLAAEADAERQLRTYFGPIEVLPESATQEEIDALGGARYIREAAYDYDSEFFRGDRWGYIVTHTKPIIDVHSIRFSYPSPQGSLWEIPKDWIRLDRKYGHIRLVPASQSFSAPLSAFIMQALGGGRVVPFMIQVRYQAGINPADFPDLVDVVKKLAVMKLLQSAFLPQSGSISADGLSESASVDLSKWHDGIEDKLNDLRDAIHGPRFAVLGIA